ncbi:MAG: hypothetical protein GX758_04440, partial [Tenericutes bacterium]|nr:hypothetical protein [Mycoplasmatota bacterium]
MSKNDSKEKLKKEDKVKEENFLDEKKTKKDVNKKYGEKTMLSKIINIVLWVILIAWMAVCLFDFYRTNQEKSPVFCISKN